MDKENPVDNRSEGKHPEDNSSARVLVPVAEPEDLKPGFFGTFTLGLSVWAREMRRILLGQAKRHEVRQLETRLREETAVLGRLEQQGVSPQNPEYQLASQQVAMLKTEIARLRREEEATEPKGGK
jgi:hypothetical protein